MNEQEIISEYFGKYLAHASVSSGSINVIYWNFHPEHKVRKHLARLFPCHTLYITRMYDAAAIRYALMQMSNEQLEQLTDDVLHDVMKVKSYLIMLVA